MRLLLVLVLTSTLAFSQQKDQKIAYHYYINGEYEDIDDENDKKI